MARTYRKRSKVWVLAFEKEKGPVKSLVIDHVAKLPAAN